MMELALLHRVRFRNGGHIIPNGTLWHPTVENRTLWSQVIETLLHRHVRNDPNAQDQTDANVHIMSGNNGTRLTIDLVDLTWVSSRLVRHHFAIWYSPSSSIKSSYLPLARVGPPLSTVNLENNLLAWWAQRMNFPPWSLYCLRWNWCWCVFLVLPVWISPIWLFLTEFWRSILLLKKKSSFSDFWYSGGMYDVPLGLHPYLGNGGRSRLEIEVEFHEGAVPLSTLLALYWTYLACSWMSVWCVSYLFFCRSNGGHFDWDGLSEGILRSWMFVILTRPTWTQGADFASSINGLWCWCIREQVQRTLPLLSHIYWCLIVILTLRTWAVWNRNQRLSIILPILYIVCWGSGLALVVRFINSTTCKWNFYAHSSLSGWFMAR